MTVIEAAAIAEAFQPMADDLRSSRDDFVAAVENFA